MVATGKRILSGGLADRKKGGYPPPSPPEDIFAKMKSGRLGSVEFGKPVQGGLQFGRLVLARGKVGAGFVDDILGR